MPARDQIHVQVRTAIEKDGWTITADPLIEYGRLEKVPLFLMILRKFAVKILIIDTQTQKVVSWQI